jgi:hypothetical protein
MVFSVFKQLSAILNQIWIKYKPNLNKILIQIGAILNRNWSKFEPKLEQNLTIIRAYFKPKLDIT